MYLSRTVQNVFRYLESLALLTTPECDRQTDGRTRFPITNSERWRAALCEAKNRCFSEVICVFSQSQAYLHVTIQVRKSEFSFTRTRKGGISAALPLDVETTRQLEQLRLE